MISKNKLMFNTIKEQGYIYQDKKQISDTFLFQFYAMPIVREFFILETVNGKKGLGLKNDSASNHLFLYFDYYYHLSNSDIDVYNLKFIKVNDTEEVTLGEHILQFSFDSTKISLYPLQTSSVSYKKAPQEMINVIPVSNNSFIFLLLDNEVTPMAMFFIDTLKQEYFITTIGSKDEWDWNHNSKILKASANEGFFSVITKNENNFDYGLTDTAEMDTLNRNGINNRPYLLYGKNIGINEKRTFSPFYLYGELIQDMYWIDGGEPLPIYVEKCTLDEINYHLLFWNLLVKENNLTIDLTNIPDLNTQLLQTPIEIELFETVIQGTGQGVYYIIQNTSALMDYSINVYVNNQKINTYTLLRRGHALPYVFSVDGATAVTQYNQTGVEGHLVRGNAGDSIKVTYTLDNIEKTKYLHICHINNNLVEANLYTADTNKVLYNLDGEDWTEKFGAGTAWYICGAEVGNYLYVQNLLLGQTEASVSLRNNGTWHQEGDVHTISYTDSNNDNQNYYFSVVTSYYSSGKWKCDFNNTSTSQGSVSHNSLFKVEDYLTNFDMQYNKPPTVTSIASSSTSWEMLYLMWTPYSSLEEFAYNIIRLKEEWEADNE